MSTEIIMPRLSESMTEGKLLRWCVQQGQFIQEGDPVAEIEADKANMEIEALASGVLAEQRIAPGQTVPIDTVLGTIDETQTAEDSRQSAISVNSASAKNPSTPPTVSPLAARLIEQHKLDIVQIPGTGPAGSITPTDVENYLASKKQG